MIEPQGGSAIGIGELQMSSRQRIHLYTIWHPNHEPRTVDEHIRVLRYERQVQWVILYDDKDDRQFKDILPQEDMDRINRQARSLARKLIRSLR